MSLLEMIRAARAKPTNPKADMIEALALLGVVLFILGVLVGLMVTS